MTVAIHATQRLFNLKASLEDYLRDTLVTVDSVKIQWPGVKFDTGGVASWVKLDYLTKVANRAYANGGSGLVALDTVLVFQLAIIARMTGATNAHTVANLRDKVAGRVHHNMAISIYDHFSIAPAVVIETGRVLFRGEEPVYGIQFAAPFPDEQLDMWVMTFGLRYDEIQGSV